METLFDLPEKADYTNHPVASVNTSSDGFMEVKFFTIAGQ